MNGIADSGQVHLSMLPEAVIAAATVPFDRASGELVNALRQFGFAIVTGILSDAEVTAAESLFSRDLRSIVNLPDDSFAATVLGKSANIARDWPATEDGAFRLGQKVAGFASDYGLPHGQCAWFCRQHPRVQAVFASIFGTDELVCGADNLFYDNRAVPPGVAEAERVDRMWPHADQSSHVAGSGQWDVFQGILYLWPASEDTSATVIWPASHLQPYADLMKSADFPRHFCKLPRGMQGDFVANAGRVRVPPGAMLLWSSKTIHQGWAIGPRLAVPICFEPRKRRDKAAYQRKQQCVMNGIPTTHWASLGIPHTVCSKDFTGGTAEVPLASLAHKWLLDANGGIIPAVAALL